MNEFYPKKSNKPLQAIRFFCFECMGWDRRLKDPVRPYEDVKNCDDEMCPLFDFRFGKDPFPKRTISPEHNEALQRGRRRSLQSS